MAEVDLIKTGISGLDIILGSGIPRGNVILLEGGIGTGKTTMGVEFVYRGATMFGEPGLIVLFEVSPDRLVRDAAGFGWDLPALERERKLKIIFTTRQVFRQEMQQADSLLLEEAAEIGARRIYVDGVAVPPAAARRCGASRLVPRPGRRPAARDPHGRLRGRSARESTSTADSRSPKNRLPIRSSG